MDSLELLKNECLEYRQNFQTMLDNRYKLKRKLYFCILNHEKLKHPTCSEWEILELLAQEFDIFVYPVKIYLFLYFIKIFSVI